ELIVAQNYAPVPVRKGETAREVAKEWCLKRDIPEQECDMISATICREGSPAVVDGCLRRGQTGDRGTFEATMELEQRKLYCQVIAYLVLVDEEVSDEEHTFLEAQMDRHELDDAARDEVLEGLDMTVPIAQLASKLTPEAGADLLKVLRQAAEADDHFDDRERALIAEVEAALGTPT
ncbi:MAG: TerB family tellurite resistance protein, partial [Nannocystaceae bacterium]